MYASSQKIGSGWNDSQKGGGAQSIKCNCGELRPRVGKSRPWPVSMFDEKVDVIGVPVHTGQDKEGVARGPQRLREHGILDSLRDMGFRINDTGDLSISDIEGDQPVHNVKNPRTLGLTNQMLQQKVAQSLRSGSSVLTLGGDHSLAVGSILGQAEVTPDIGVIYVDAHADLNPPLSSLSGHSHGMPLAFLIRELKEFIPKPLPQWDWIKPCLQARDVTFIALRDVDPAEKYIIDKYKITAYTMHDVIKYGIDRVAQQAVEAASRRHTRPIHLSFDIDSLDPSEAPSTGTPVPGGLSLREGIHIVETAAATGLLKVMDMTEVNPELLDEKDQRKTLDAASHLIKSWFGHRNLKLIPPSYQLTKPHNNCCNPINR